MKLLSSTLFICIFCSNLIASAVQKTPGSCPVVKDFNFEAQPVESSGVKASISLNQFSIPLARVYIDGGTIRCHYIDKVTRDVALYVRETTVPGKSCEFNSGPKGYCMVSSSEDCSYTCVTQ